MTDDDDVTYGRRSWRDDDGLLTIEFLTEDGLYSIDRLSDIETFNFADEVEGAGDDWEPVAARWASGYRNAQP